MNRNHPQCDTRDPSATLAIPIYTLAYQHVRLHDKEMRASESYRQEFERNLRSLISEVKDARIRRTFLYVLQLYLAPYEQIRVSV